MLFAFNNEARRVLQIKSIIVHNSCQICNNENTCVQICNTKDTKISEQTDVLELLQGVNTVEVGLARNPLGTQSWFSSNANWNKHIKALL